MAIAEKRSFQEFIKIMSERNNYQYDYSLLSEIDYYKSGSDRLIPIICKIHGEVMMHQGKHASIKGSKCTKCVEDLKENKSKEKYDLAKLKQEANIKYLLTTLYGDSNLYKVWLDENLTIHIDCLKHGNIRKIFRHQSHLDLTTASQKCIACRDERLEAIQKKKKVIALQRPQRLLKKRLKLLEPQEYEFAELIENISGKNRDVSRYSYSYDHSKINKLFNNYKIPYKIPVTCTKHGEYQSVLERHLIGKSNCLVCAGIARISKEDCFARFVNMHGTRFDYSKFKFISMNKISLVRCIEHNSWFKTTASNHLLCESSGGCKQCKTSGLDSSKPAILYYLSINNGQAYKIGITNFDVNKRFIKDKTFTYKIIEVWTYENGKDAFDKELEIKREFKEAQYKGDPLMKSGNTELFTHDILGLDI